MYCCFAAVDCKKEDEVLISLVFDLFFQSFETLSVESGGSGPEKDDPPGKMNLYNTYLLYSGATL